MSTVGHPAVGVPGRAADDEGIFRRSPYPLVLITLAIIAVLVITGAGFLLKYVPLDRGLSLWLNGFHVGVIGALTSAVYHVFSPGPAIALTILAAAVIWWVHKDLRPAVAFGGVVAVTWLPSAIVKLLVHRPRPDTALQPHHFVPVQVDASYPSGHMVFIVAIVIALVYVLRDTRWYRLTVALGTILAVVVGLSLMIDGVHYPTDVAASIAWSLAIAPAVRVVGVDLVMPQLRFLNRSSAQRALPR
ncbi:undecaprenyl-diphosphatase [Raineyella antarctica]|uniref:Undecaprenyl-diphosphatase n=1 Tax=Raineyella antarctica TaxID=1577474 RepID=A0A1G6GNU9_9ACTN|nr:phosphatase PAP2 family protein [Raineyella antarctica]SDB83604.1 undecaprenyl-diphosphatase [Raineyella antarctica]